jgi:signal peptidase II
MAVGRSRTEVWAWTLALIGAVVAVDQIAKQIVSERVTRGDPFEIIFGIEISNVRNDGIAFGLLSGGDALVLAFTLATLGLLLTYFAFTWQRPGEWIAVGLLVGGALGNLADRMRDGAVVDFVDFPLWPAFNLADVAIVAGVTLLAMIVLEAHHEQDRTSDETHGPAEARAGGEEG